MKEANKVIVSTIVKDSLEEIKVMLLGKILSKGDLVGALKVHDIEPEKSKITKDTEIQFESDLK